MSTEFPLFHGSDQAVVRLGASHLSIRVGRWQSGSPSVSLNGTIYCTPTGDNFGQVLKAYSPDGTELWRHVFDAYIFRPVVSRDGTVYVAASQNQAHEPTLTLYAFSDAGKVLWSRSWSIRRSGSAPICDAHGAVYIILNEEMHKINPTGEVSWSVPATGHEPSLLGISIGQVSMLVGDGWQNCLRAVSQEGQERWDLKAPFDAAGSQREFRQRLVEKHGQERANRTHVHITYAPPRFENRTVFTSSGDLIIADIGGRFYSISSEGRINWQFDPEKAISIGSAAGTAAAYVTWDEGLYAITKDGELLWKQRQRYTTVPVVGREGQVYVAGNDEASAFDANGNLLWVKPIQDIPGPYPVSMPGNQFCVTTNQGYLYLLG